MTAHEGTTVGELPGASNGESRVPTALTRAVWGLWLLSLGVLAAHFSGNAGWELPGIVAVDGLTAVMWTAVTFFSGIVHSYSKRYMAGTRNVERFFGRVFAFTLAVMVLVAADSLVLFGAAWLAMGLVMARLIGHLEGWPQATAAAALSRTYFLGSAASLGLALATLWWYTGATTVSGVASNVGAVPTAGVVFAAAALLLAAMVQSALFPFHTWLLSSMTGPTPASALMHAGFVNAGGVLLVRFAPVVTAESAFTLLVLTVGATSALGGKLLKRVQPDVKGELGCSTVGQMGFMIMQAGLGFFGAAITHLILHGFYKAYQFLGAGSEVEHESPEKSAPTRRSGALDAAVVVATALAGGALFAALTGKGTELGSGLLLTALVVLTVLHAAREVVTRAALPAALRYGGVPLISLPALAVYAAAYRVVEAAIAGLPGVAWEATLTPVHALVAAAFLGAYLAIETGVLERSERLYVALLNAGQPASDTLLTSTEEYNEY